MTRPLTQRKIRKILQFYPNSIIVIDNLNKVIIDDKVYIEKKSIYEITTLNKIEIKNILNKTSSLRSCLEKKELRTIKIKNNERDYLLYCYDDIIELDNFKKNKSDLIWDKTDIKWTTNYL